MDGIQKLKVVSDIPNVTVSPCRDGAMIIASTTIDWAAVICLPIFETFAAA